MKNYTQVYVKNSFEAAETYCKAFGAEITRAFKNEDNTIYEHCELSVNGEGFLALAEAKNLCDINIVLIKLQNRVAVTSIDYPRRPVCYRSISCFLTVVASVSAARYCKRFINENA